jgi:hypothetical protein
MKRELIEIGSTIRVENGPARKVAVATEEMEPDRDDEGRADPNAQSKHAVLPDGKKLAVHYKLSLKDAFGKKIVAGQEFTYLDYFGELVWYIYQLGEVGVNEKGEILFPDSPYILKNFEPEDRVAVRTEERWLPVGIETTRERALTAAHLLED